MKKSILSKNIKKLRAFKNITQSEFSDLFDIKRSSIGAYEEGRAEPKLETLIKMSDYFNLSIDDLVKKELTINKITKFDEKFNKYNQNGDIMKLKSDIKELKSHLFNIESKIDLLLPKK